MKAQRIVQSYWSKAYQNTPNSGWAFLTQRQYYPADSAISPL